MADLTHDSIRIGPDHSVGAMRYGDWKLRGVSQRKAWHAKDSAFFLEAPGIGQNEARPGDGAEGARLLLRPLVGRADEHGGHGGRLAHIHPADPREIEEAR